MIATMRNFAKSDDVAPKVAPNSGWQQIPIFDQQLAISQKRRKMGYRCRYRNICNQNTIKPYWYHIFSVAC